MRTFTKRRKTRRVRRGSEGWSVGDEWVDDAVRKNDAKGPAETTWRKGKMGYRNRTSLWEIKLSVKTMAKDVQAKRDNILCGTTGASGTTGLGELEAFAEASVDCAVASRTKDALESCDEARSACHKPTIVNGSAVVSRSGNPSVR
jgi:hypothetical protein